MVQTQERPAPPAETPTPTATRSRVWIAIGLITVLAAATLLLRLGVQERSGPPHTSYISLPNGAPATLYVPGHLFHGEFPLPPAPGRRPPLVVVAHGYSADRQTMSSIARSLAKAGYAALALDFRGHGANTRPFRGELDGDLRSALDWADRSPYVDRTRIALFGHSMGASAVLEFASRDPRAKAVIPLSGGDVVDDAHVPPNVLLMAAARDPKVIRDQQAVVARELRGRTNVRTVIVPGKDHLTELWSGTMMRQSISWLDRSLGVARTGPVPGMADPRLGTAGLYFLVTAVLIGFVGAVAARLVPRRPSGATGAAWLLLAAALVLTVPIMAVGQLGVLPLTEDGIVVSLALTGALLWAARWFAAGRGVVAGWLGTESWLPLRSVLLPGAAAGVALFLVLMPLGAVFHRLVPTPERFVLWVVAAALLLPFFSAFEAIVRRGGLWPSIGWGVLGRALLLAALVAGVAIHTLSPVIALVIPLVALLFVLLEVFAGAAYAVAPNPALIAVVDAVFIAWIATIAIPVI